MRLHSSAALMAVLFAGCDCDPNNQVTSNVVSNASENLTKEEEKLCKQVAWDAVHSVETLNQFSLRRITKDPFVFRKAGMHCYLHRDIVDVAVPSGGKVGWHDCFVGVKMKRESHEILEIWESFWP